MLAEEWRQGRLRYVPIVDDVFKKYLLRLSKPLSEMLPLQLRARKGKLNPDRDWLYLSLLDIWINQFRGELKASTRPRRPLRALRQSCDGLGTASQRSTPRRCRSSHRACTSARQIAWTISDCDPVIGAQRPWRR